MIVSLTGFMGCGKSSVGKRLAALLSCRFIDLDSYIEEREQMKIPEIFESCGESGFREKEYEALHEIISEHSAANNGELTILSLGGGTLTTEKCRKAIRSGTSCIYLKASTDTLVRNLGSDSGKRPLIQISADSTQNLEQRICSLMKERAGTYEDCACATVGTDGKTVGEVACHIYGLITGSL